jgi:hypothetical protein
MKVIYVIPLAIFLFVATGFAGIWTLNTLFPLYAIDYGFRQVLAMTLLVAVFAGNFIIKILKIIMFINQ